MGTATHRQSEGESAPPSSRDGPGRPARAGPDGVTRDDLFHVLRNRRRRFAIHHLKRASGPVDVGELATQVAAWENGVSASEVTSRQRRRVYNALQQTHVPELDETGIVDVDRREVELTDRADDLDLYLEVVPTSDVPWSKYYLVLGVVGLVAVGVTWLNAGPVGAFPDVTAGAFLSVALLVSAGANYVDQHQGRLGESERPPELRGE